MTGLEVSRPHCGAGDEGDRNGGKDQKQVTTGRGPGADVPGAAAKAGG